MRNFQDAMASTVTRTFVNCLSACHCLARGCEYPPWSCEDISPDMLTLVAAVEVYDFARERRDSLSLSLYAMSDTNDEKDIMLVFEGLGGSPKKM